MLQFRNDQLELFRKILEKNNLEQRIQYVRERMAQIRKRFNSSNRGWHSNSSGNQSWRLFNMILTKSMTNVSGHIFD